LTGSASLEAGHATALGCAYVRVLVGARPHVTLSEGTTDR
jgi:hypothetical protein